MKFFKIMFFVFLINIVSFSKVTDQMIIAQEGAPRTFDPHFGNDGFSLRINRLIYSRLIEKDSNMKNQLGVAKNYKILSPKEIDFELKDNVFFQNGEPLTSEDVKFSFERMKKSPKIAAFLPPIEKIEIIDNRKFKMILSKPFSSIIDSLTHPALSIVSKKYLEKDDKILKNYPMGSGKYRLKKYDIGNYILLERNEGFYGEKGKYKILKIKEIPLATNRTIALETKEVDLALTLPYKDKELVENMKGIKYISKPSYSYTYLGLNLKKDCFKNRDLRKAIDLSINKDEILNIVLNNEGKIANSPVAEGVLGYDKNLKSNREYNPKKAKELLKDKKYKLTLATLNNEIDATVAELIQGYLKNIGIDVEIYRLEPNLYWTKTSNGEYDMFIGNWGCVTGEADYALYPTHHTKGIEAKTNRTYLSNKEIDDLLDKARATVNIEKRCQIYSEVQRKIIDEKSEIMLFYRNLNAGIDKENKTFELYPIPIPDYSI